jgi:transposase
LPGPPGSLAYWRQIMFLRSTKRKKDGKEHRYFSVVENVRAFGHRYPFQKTLLYLGEINDAQQSAWIKAIRVLDEDSGQSQNLNLFPDDHPLPKALVDSSVLVRLADYQLKNPRQYGACWLACELWRELQLDSFWSQRLKPSREGTDWAKSLAVSVAYRLIEPGSEWRCHRLWYDRSAMGDLLGEGFVWGGKDQLYGVLDRLLKHRDELFKHLQARWRDLFGTKLDVLLYDLTSTYFEGQAEEIKKARYGYSRDHRPDSKQVVLALVVTPEGFPVGYEVMNGNTLDKETLPEFMKRIEALYGPAQRVWLMDRGIPTEDQLTALRAGPTPVKYLVGTPRAQVRKTRSKWEDLPWTQVRDAIEVKLFQENQELYVVVRSDGRQHKEMAIRRKKLARLLWTLRGMRKETQRDRLLMRWGAAKAKAGRAASLVEVRFPKPKEKLSPKTFSFALKKEQLKDAELYDGHYLLRSNLSDKEPEWLWQLYMLLVRIEGVFRCFKNDLGIRPVYHQNDARVEAHIFVCFQAYCLWVTLQERLRPLAPGLTPRQALDQLAGIQMLDVELPTSDGRLLKLSRYTQPDPATKLLLQRLGKNLPEQPPPKLSSPVKMELDSGAV